MLRPGLAASLRSLTHLRPSSSTISSTFNQIALRTQITPRLENPRKLFSPKLFRSAQPYRNLTTSTTLTARLPYSSRRRDPPLTTRKPLNHAAVADAVEQDLLHEGLPTPPPSEAQQPSISRALLFLFGLSALSFTGAAYYSLKDTEHIASELRSSRDVFSNISSFFNSPDTGSSEVWGAGITEKRLLVAKKHETAERLGLRMQWLMGWCEQLRLPAPVTEFVGRNYIICAEKYLELSPSKQVVVPIVGVNAAVFLAWTIAGARRGGGMWRFMTREFLHRPSANRTRTMVTSVFSHQTFLHFLFNNMALWSIGGSALVLATHLSSAPSRGGEGGVPESSYTPHFLAFFATAGVFAATVSHVVSAVRFRRIASLHSLSLAKTTIGQIGRAHV